MSRKVRSLIKDYINKFLIKKSNKNYIQCTQKIKGKYYKGDLYEEEAFDDNEELIVVWGDITKLSIYDKYTEVYAVWNNNVIHISIYVDEKLINREIIQY